MLASKILRLSCRQEHEIRHTHTQHVFFRGDKRNSPRPIALTRQKFRWHNKRITTRKPRGKTNSHIPSGLLKQITQKERKTSTWKSNRQVTSSQARRSSGNQLFKSQLELFQTASAKGLDKTASREPHHRSTPHAIWSLNTGFQLTMHFQIRRSTIFMLLQICP